MADLDRRETLRRRTFLAAVPLAAAGFGLARAAAAQTAETAPPLSPALPDTDFFADVAAGERANSHGAGIGREARDGRA